MEKINWREFSKETFQEAKEKDIPVLLSLSASWCHWCHVMDRTSYSDEGIVDFINNNFIPVRVDSDKRPDINNRYNMGGWPTTAFLTPEGNLMTGGTYIPPEEMKNILENIHTIYREQKPEIIKQILSVKPKQKDQAERTDSNRLREEAYNHAVERIKRSFDQRYGGFGKQPKFPMVDALELAAHRWLSRDDQECGEIFIKSLEAMVRGGMYDHQEGGFFRYSTTRDWSIPHFEKMLEDNAGLLKLLCIAYQATRDDSYRETIKETLHWLQKVMYLPETKCWAGSQDADESYYSFSLEQRRNLQTPYVDKSIYVNWNAQLADTLFLVGATLRDTSWRQKALDTLAALDKLCYSREQGYAHYYHGQGAHIYGLLADQVSVGMALTTAFQHTGEKEFLDKSERLALWCINKLRSPSGGFFDSLPDPHGVGDMAVPFLDLQQNAWTASWFLILGSLNGSSKFQEEAKNILQTFAGSFKEYGLMASSYALAVFSALKPWIRVEITGTQDKKGYGRLFETALTTYIPNKTVVPRLSGPKEEEKGYVCRGTQCYQPVNTPRELIDLMGRLASEN